MYINIYRQKRERENCVQTKEYVFHAYVVNKISAAEKHRTRAKKEKKRNLERDGFTYAKSVLLKE